MMKICLFKFALIFTTGKLVVKSDGNALEILVKFIISCVSKLKAFSSKLEIRKKSYEYFYKVFVNLNIKK